MIWWFSFQFVGGLNGGALLGAGGLGNGLAGGIGLGGY